MEQKKIEQLVKKAMKRDEDALKVLLSQYQEYLYRIAYAYYKNEQEALDAVSECVAKVYVSLPKLRKPEYFKTWMTRILSNEVLSGVKIKSKVISLDALNEQGYMPEYEDKGISREEKADLYQALDKLSPDYRKVLILKYFQEMKIKEIGEVMEIPQGTVKVMIHRGRKRLQRILVEEMGYEE
ncbi:MAG: sigma-70 family RNA polymerase sigma factor [Oliverpabstia sp.]